LHLANKRKDQIKSRNMKLPELSENSELDITSAGISPINPCTLSPNPSSPSKDKGMPQISVTDYLEPPPPTDDPVTPSLPSSFLKKLGLSVKETSPSSQIEDNGESEVSVDQLPQKELESKFISLSLAFKTDKFTLLQRVKVQERSRDLAEQNVDSEIKSLRELLESLYEQVSEPQARTIVQKLRQNIDVLEQTAARVSSRAEVYGAVQQEQRMCQALEVMVLYTENLKRIREREESELLEARKVLSERTVNGYSVDTDSTSGRRSMSVSGISPGGRPMRRRSEIALPKVLGGSGSPSMIQTASLETASPFLDRSYPSFNLLGVFAETGEDPKSRFQSAVASMSMQHAVTSTVRQASLEKQRSMSFTPSLSPSSSLGSPFSPSTPSHQSISSVTESGRKISQDEDAFRKGYEEGLKAKLSRELNELREQQNCISHNLEHMMDRVDQTEQEEEEFLSRPTRLDTLLGYSTRFTQKLLQHDWRSNKKLIRNLAGFFLVFLAIFIVFLSPPISTVDIRQITRPPT
ncbi:lymphoid-restricted membrane protein-like isoform X7, partial [Biomphalaria glabrata]